MTPAERVAIREAIAKLEQALEADEPQAPEVLYTLTETERKCPVNCLLCANEALP